MEEREYFATEIPIVETSIALIQYTFDLNKYLLTTVTLIADTLSAAENSTTTVFQSSSISAASTIATEDATSQCNRWISELTRDVEIFESLSVDLGSTLYPPVEADAEDLSQAYRKLYLALQGFLINCEEDLTKFVSLVNGRWFEGFITLKTRWQEICNAEVNPLVPTS
jgi:hypothetical protein